ncbi:pentatricopeptide repeat-containing protein At3g05340-like, partial [Selaginella moellendorffii]|uniref:pentatricopeptide repeat-containing protein At3g05340-like n=1 Tax=Selaginella moellendorffii TaxID=88036 RepID=UPI000D1CE66A
MAIKLGREIHQLVKHKELLKNNPVLGSSLVSFYGKCSDVDSAQEAFDECQARDNTGLWNSLIQAYTFQGRSIETLERFYSMTQEEACKADDVSFVSVLNTCSHGGLGRQLLDEMPKQYGVKPRLEHYVCLIDMLGRANLLDEAVRVLRAMPFEPDAVVWTSLLGACWKWKNYTIGKLAFECLVEMDPKSGTPYALMANIFGNLGMLSERAAVVERMRGEGSFRSPGEAGGRMLALFPFLGMADVPVTTTFENMSVLFLAVIPGFKPSNPGMLTKPANRCPKTDQIISLSMKTCRYPNSLLIASTASCSRSKVMAACSMTNFGFVLLEDVEDVWKL